MNLGRYASLKRGLTSVFGRDCYTDDNSVVYVDGDQESVASLWVVRNGWVTIYRPRRPVVDIRVPGARMGLTDACYWPAAIKRHHEEVAR